MTMHHTWGDARTESRAEAIITVLRAHGIAVPAAVRKRLMAQKSLKQLDRWLAKASVATSLEEVFGNRG